MSKEQLKRELTASRRKLDRAIHVLSRVRRHIGSRQVYDKDSGAVIDAAISELRKA